MMIGPALAALLAFPAAVIAGTGVSTGMETESLGSAGIGASLVVHEANGISYVSGGVGDEQQEALKSASKQFNLRLTLAGNRGHYMGGAEVRIDDPTGKTLLSTSANGPLFFAKVPPGTYKVHATSEGKTFTREITIPQQGHRELTMTWPETSEEPVRAGDAPVK
jgi:hypothetical protein